ncbi:ABC transporter permease subunit [Clostridium sp. SYSU_GA19001]|uniref:ABC transporter permease n=1 Tax=Clostridium caldaquaticum TaxID=2940653 RepID=UPI0020774F0B|nr:ABC transporter permease subunit [Clostridium caldaquaticum]MCM8711847.1 ABC transporter permease subunit [Clostridium caldaquaticum]
MISTVKSINGKLIRKEKILKKIRYIKDNYQLYLFILPAIVLTFIFAYLPMYGIVIAFKDFNVLKGILGSPWVGFKHFERFIDSPNFMLTFKNTLLLSIYGLLWGFPAPIALALMLNRVRSKMVKKNIQLIVYAPNFISVVVIAGMIFIFLSPVGPVNKIITAITGKTVNFMLEPSYFRTIFIASGIWQGAGWASIIYTAALSNVSQDLIDAAVIDGASILKQIIHIDLPTIKSIMVIQFILAAGGIMNAGGDKALLLQTAGNNPTSEVISTFTYKIGLERADFSYGAAVGVFNAVINVILLVLVDQIVKRLNEGQGL